MLRKIIRALKNDILMGNRLWNIEQTICSHTSKDINFIAQAYIDKHIDSYEEICQMLRIKGTDKKLIRLGRENDGGYIMANLFSSDTVAYSFGIADDISWDLAVAEKGIPVYMYDHTIDGINSNNPLLNFFKIGVGGGTAFSCNKIKRLQDLIVENKHENNNSLILKMDIEGYEYEVIEDTPLHIWEQFSQVIIEFHDILNPSNIIFKNCLAKLNQVFQVIHIHGQNVLPQVRIGDDKMLPNFIEVTFLRRSDNSFCDVISRIPLPIDSPTYAGKPELYLGNFY